VNLKSVGAASMAVIGVPRLSLACFFLNTKKEIMPYEDY